MSDTEDAADNDLTPWERTVAEMDDLASQRAANGWETVTVQAGDTAPEPPGAGDSDRFGLVYTVPNDVADEFRAAYEGGTFDQYSVYRRKLGDTLFLMTAFEDTEGKTAILVAGAVDLSVAEELRTAAHEAGEMYSHVQLLDWTNLGSFRHDDPAAFFPDPK